MKYETVEKKMLAGFMPGGYAAVTRRQVAFFLMQLFGVDESSITRWRVQGNIPPLSVLKGLSSFFLNSGRMNDNLAGSR